MASPTDSESVLAEPPPIGWLAGACLTDIDRGAITGPSSIAIESGRITQILAGEPPSGALNVVRADGLHLLPGLITCHVHLQATYPYSRRDPNEPPEDTISRARAHAGRLLPAGITTIRTVHEQAQADLHVRRAMERSRAPTPRIFAGGRALTVPGGHGDGLGAIVAEGADEFYQAARNELEAGADHVKIFASGGLARAGEALDKTEMSQQEMAGAVRAAVERATYVVAHTATSSSIRVGLSAGVRCFEHAYMLDERTAQEMAAAGAYLTPTLVVTHVPDWMSEAGFPPDSIERSRQMAVHHMDSVATAIAAGVAIVNGTDFPPSATSDGTSLTVRELELLVAAGLTPLTALRSATTTAAQLLGLSHETARWQAGALADFVGVEENPLTSISALRRIVLVVRAGRTVSDQTPGSE